MIISLDIPEGMKAEVDRLVQREGFGSRSDFIRQAIRSHLAEAKVSDMSGNIIATLTIVYDRGKSREDLRRLQHRFEDVVSVQLHSDLEETQCLEVFILRGDSVRISNLLKAVKTMKGVHYSKLAVT